MVGAAGHFRRSAVSMSFTLDQPVLFIRTTAVLGWVFGSGLMLAAPKPPAAPRPDQGAIAPSGKFVPNDGAMRAPSGSVSGAVTPQLAELPPPEIEKLADGTMRVGLVSVDPKARTLSFPAAVNAREGLIEYALVTEAGKVHESLLNTKVVPLHLHLAALLLNLAPKPNAPSPVRISIEVEWATNGPKRRATLEELINLTTDRRVDRDGAGMSRDGWLYSGSYLLGKQFAADIEGSIISLIGDTAALIANPRPDAANDKIHVPNAAKLPSLGLPVTVILRAAP